MDKQRFSLLLLEPNEIYFEDYSVDLLHIVEEFSNHSNEKFHKDEKIRGRLKLCSKSLVFEPKDHELPLMKFRFFEIESISEGHKETVKNVLFVKCLQYIEMLKNNIIAPYNIREKKVLLFNFHYAQVNNYLLQLCQQLHRASSLSNLEQNDMIAAIVYSRHNRLKFDPLWLDSIYEEILYDCKVDEIHPLVTNPGRILLTNACIYFQPYNNIKPYPVLKIKLHYIISFTKRRYLLRHTGLEIKWENDDISSSTYISFRNSNERDDFLTIILKQSNVNIRTVEQEAMTLKWQNRLISNYEYLIYLNSLADRSIEDLSQYPIFPWIIIDYESQEINLNDDRIYRDLSKPIGALNNERLSRLKERCEEMGDAKYLYGSHYSTPGFVLFYLVRKYPHLMLCLQNGRFDHPDRMFNKLSDTFKNCLTNMSDFKELIPEFYDISQEGDFLVNSKKINFGIRSDGVPVNHVELPPWAKSSPKLFVETLRNALESDYVSANLHHWIDLIFGYKQRGEEAIKADNIFYPLCYEGSVDLDTIKEPSARHALEVQISEFGQIPKQLFNRPHVSRISSSSCCTVDSPIKVNENNFSFNDLELLISYAGHKDQITSILIDDDMIISTGKDGILKCFQMSEKRQTRNIAISALPLSSCQKIPNSNIYALGSWDNTILLYNCNYGKISDTIPAHDDSVSSLSFLADLGILISGSWDCSVKVWKGFMNIDYKTFRLSNSMIAYLSLDDKITCLASRINKSNGKNESIIEIYIGTEIGEIYLWNLIVKNSQQQQQQQQYEWDNVEQSEPQLLLKHDTEITCMKFNWNQTKLASCSLNGLLVVTDISTGMTLFKNLNEFSLVNLCWCNSGSSNTSGSTSSVENRNFEYLLCIDVNGYLSVWNLIHGTLKLKKKLYNGPLSCIRYCQFKNIVVVGGKDESNFKISCWSLV